MLYGILFSTKYMSIIRQNRVNMNTDDDYKFIGKFAVQRRSRTRSVEKWGEESISKGLGTPVKTVAGIEKTAGITISLYNQNATVNIDLNNQTGAAPSDATNVIVNIPEEEYNERFPE